MAADQPDILRVNCGCGEDFVGPSCERWLADRPWADGRPWGAVGGQAVRREATLPIRETALGEVYRTERYGLKGYRFAMGEGCYVLRLHFAETFGCNHVEGKRSFAVRVNGAEVCSLFDPYREAGRFAQPVVLEVAGCRPANGEIVLSFEGDGILNAVEVERAARAAEFGVRRLTRRCAPCERTIGSARAFDRAGRAWRVLFVGNSGTFYWAMPESLQAMLATGQSAVRIEPARALAGGKTLAWHYEQTDVRGRIQRERFDMVVLQEGSASLDGQFEETRKYVGLFDRAVRAAGGRTVLYAYGGRADLGDERRRVIAKVHAELAERHGAALVPACEALRLAMATRPQRVHYDDDGVHLGMFGGYVVACAFYAVFSGLPASSHPAPAILAQQVAIAPEAACELQNAADAAVAAWPRLTRIER